MNRRELIKASAAKAAIALTMIGYRTTHAGLVGAGEVYIDPSAIGTGHSGTYADPYSTADALIYFSLLRGDLFSQRIRFKAGTTFVGRVNITDASNYVIEPYGSGAKPVIHDLVTVASGHWSRVGSTDEWTIPNSNWGGGDTAVIIDGHICETRQSLADLRNAALVYQDVLSGQSYPYRQWYDAGAAVMHIMVANGDLPNSMVVQRPNLTFGVRAPMTLSTGSGVEVSDIILAGGDYYNFQSIGISALRLNRVDSINAGGNDGNFSRSSFSILGADIDHYATDIVLHNCLGRRARNNNVEMWWVDGFRVYDHRADNTDGHGFEFWQSQRNVEIHRARIRQAYSLACTVTGTESPLTVHHEHVLISNCECVQRVSYRIHGSGSGSQNGGAGVIAGAFGDNTKSISDWKIYNNSFDIDDFCGLYCYTDGTRGVGAQTLAFKNNVVRQSQISQAVAPVVYASQESAWVMDRNVYQFGQSARWQNGAGVHSSLAAWRTALGGGRESNSVGLSNSTLLLSVPGGTLATANLSLISKFVIAVGLADSDDAYTPTTDILGVTRDGSPDAGAYEYVDSDADGVQDSEDNCIDVPNGPVIPDAGGSSQRDSDGDGYGNLCDGDLNNNGATNAQDYAIFRTRLDTSDPVADLNGNGIVNSQDFSIFQTLVGAAPGPSGLVP